MHSTPTYVFSPPPLPYLAVADCADVFPVRRIFCVGRNYADHAREMGALDQASGLEPPFFFMKPADALVSGVGEIAVAYPPQTANLQHEVEMVVALAAGGADIPRERALECVFGYTVAVSYTHLDVYKRQGHASWVAPNQRRYGQVPQSQCGPQSAARCRCWLRVRSPFRASLRRKLGASGVR